MTSWNPLNRWNATRRRAIAAAVIGASVAFGVSAAEPADVGPNQLLITYRAAPADRPAFREYLAGEGRAPFDRLVRDGALASYQVLYNPFVTSDTWDAMVVLSFKRYADTARWKEVERKQPGGLTARGLKLAHPVDTFAASIAWESATEGASARDAVYYVIPYEYRSADEYRKYVQGYVLPQVEGWKREGLLTGYRIFMNPYPVGRPWDSLFIYQYRDQQAFGQRQQVLDSVRQGLKNDPTWQKYHETKGSIRSEAENTIAESIEPAGRQAP